MPPCCVFLIPQGHIALDVAVFPEGTPGCALDTLARVPLWREGLNYRYGTGHGVGAALNVHEVKPKDYPYVLGIAVCKQFFPKLSCPSYCTDQGL